MNFSIYTSAFNLHLGVFNVAGALKNWLEYADEIVIAVPSEHDRDIIELSSFCHEPANRRIKILQTDVLVSDRLYDGKLKNESLQACKNDIVIQCDLDERLYGNKEFWELIAQRVLVESDFQAVMMPVIDLYGDFFHYKSIGTKWRMHKKEGSFRGPVNFARNPDGTIDKEKSDGCELIDENGDLFRSPVVGDVNCVGVAHYGYLNLLNKALLNREHWENAWSNLCGDKVNLPKSKEEFKENPIPVPDFLDFKSIY